MISCDRTDRLRSYLHSLSRGQGTFLDRIREEAEATGVPVIRVEMEAFLEVFLKIHRPARILEAGTAVGYSSMLMAKQTEGWGARIDTIEKDSERVQTAGSNIGASPWKDRITLIEGDAVEVLARLLREGRSYDFLFMDAAKGQYIRCLPYAVGLLREGGLMISDNVLQGQTLMDSHFALERRERTIYKRMREFLRVLKTTEGLVTSIVPIGDGAAVTVKEKEI